MGETPTSVKRKRSWNRKKEEIITRRKGKEKTIYNCMGGQYANGVGAARDGVLG